VAEHTSKRERVAMEAERDVVEMKKLQYMQKHVGEEFDGYISGVTGFGFFVELEQLFVEGLVHITTLEDDQYAYAEKQHSLIGSRSARVFRIGDAVRVTVASVTPATRRIEFVLAAHTASNPATRSTHRVFGLEEYPKTPLRGKRLTGLQPRGERSGIKADDTGNKGRSRPRKSGGRNRR
jgi:ribonuclease R